MLFNKRTTYGLRALLELASAGPAGQLTSLAISQRTGISKKFLDQLLLKLSSRGFVQSRKGQKGGYLLGMKPDAIRIGEVLEVLNGPLAFSDCLRSGHLCTRKNHCAVFFFVDGLQKHMEKYLEKKTLRDMADLQGDSPASYTI